MALSGTRRAGKAGSWYSSDPAELNEELDGWLNAVPDTVNGSQLPISGARIVIVPHAGYSYSGPCAAWSYKCLDLRGVKRVFILGPSHTYGLYGPALTTFEKHATPFGDLVVDKEAIVELKATKTFSEIPRRADESEHNLEMQLPYLWKRFEQTFKNGEEWPTIVPMLVGSGNTETERALAKTLLPHLKDPATAFVISSDFCHWGSNYDYYTYCQGGDINDLVELSPRDTSLNPPIHESIKILDTTAMEAIESGSYDNFKRNLSRTHNTVCGRHPISVAMAGLEALAKEKGAQPAEGQSSDEETKGKGSFTFIQYQRSSLVKKPSGSSVSYAAAYAII